MSTGRHSAVTAWRIVPVSLGVALAGLTAATSRSLGLIAVAVAVLLGAIWPAKATSVGALLVLPLVLVALFRAATHSAGLMALAVLATPFVILTSALLACGGSFIGHALGRDN